MIVKIIPYRKPDNNVFLTEETATMILSRFGMKSVLEIPNEHMLVIQEPQDGDTEVHTLALSRVGHKSGRVQPWLLIYHTTL